MRNTSLIIPVPHLLSPISAFSAESKTYICSSVARFTKHLKYSNLTFRIQNTLIKELLFF